MYKIFSSLSLTLCLSFVLSACGSDPIVPQDERHNKHHEDPTKAEFVLTKGFLKEGIGVPLVATSIFEQSPTRSQFVATEAPQVLTKVLTEGEGWQWAPGSDDEFHVESTHKEPQTVYLLSINYYNIYGQLMNHQFIDNGQDKIHQHFFSYYRNNIRVTKPELLPFQYVYADEDQAGHYTALTSPMGFIGFLRFTGKEGHYDLTVDLMHAIDSKYDHEGKPSPFYAPSAAQIGRALWDISTDLPFHVEP